MDLKEFNRSFNSHWNYYKLPHNERVRRDLVLLPFVVLAVALGISKGTSFLGIPAVTAGVLLVVACLVQLGYNVIRSRGRIQVERDG